MQDLENTNDHLLNEEKVKIPLTKEEEDEKNPFEKVFLSNREQKIIGALNSRDYEFSANRVGQALIDPKKDRMDEDIRLHQFVT